MTRRRRKAVLFKSTERFEAFKQKLVEKNVETAILDFEDPRWIEFDFNGADYLIYYPSFKFSSNHPLALHSVYDELAFLHEEYPNLRMFPDPRLIKYYNDKYRQFLFLKSHRHSTPRTIPLVSRKALEEADRELGYPMIVKNRYGAGGYAVYRIGSRSELQELYELSCMNFVHIGALKYYSKLLSRRLYYYHAIKAKRAEYPFLSMPLLAQEFLRIDRDLKTVVCGGSMVEAHWRIQANTEMWKMNIDGGGIGEWSKVPQSAIELSERVSRDLGGTWVNFDIIFCGEVCYITEFSPVWHHYRYKEKPSFVYKDDYNIGVPLIEALDLEEIIVNSLLETKEPA